MANDTNTKALEQWLRSNGGFLHDNIRITWDSTSGVHIRATRHIEPGTTIISTPPSLSLSYLNALVDENFPVFQQQRHRFKIEAIGYFYLMAQYVNREVSFWKPYLSTLPQPDEDFSQPLFYEDPEDIAWLEGTDVWHTVTAQKDIYRKYYDDGIEVLREADVDVEPYTWHLFLWATTMFASRSFISQSLHPEEQNHDWTTYKSTLEGQRRVVSMDMSNTPPADLIFPVLFPGLDAANHNHDAKVDWLFEPDRFSITTAEGIEKDQEVLNNYGPKGNDELLIGYGFCILENPHDTVAITLKEPPQDLQLELKNIRPDYFNADGVWDAEKATFRLKCPNFEDGVPEHIFQTLPEPLLELLIYILLHERGLSVSHIAQPLVYLTSTTSLDHRYLPHIARMIAQSLIPKLSRLTTHHLLTEPKNQKQRYAAIYRQSQTHILETLIEALKTYTRSLIWTPQDPALELSSGPHLVRLDILLPFLIAHGSLDEAFLHGIEANTNTQDLEQLRLAGWEEDIWVLLLCYMYLQLFGSSSLGKEHERLLGRLFPDYVAHGTHGPTKAETEQASSLLPIVQTATETCPGSLWQDERWGAEFIATVGGKILRLESFMVMVAGGKGGDEARLFVCVG